MLIHMSAGIREPDQHARVSDEFSHFVRIRIDYGKCNPHLQVFIDSEIKNGVNRILSPLCSNLRNTLIEVLPVPFLFDAHDVHAVPLIGEDGTADLEFFAEGLAEFRFLIERNLFRYWSVERVSPRGETRE